MSSINEKMKRLERELAHFYHLNDINNDKRNLSSDEIEIDRKFFLDVTQAQARKSFNSKENLCGYYYIF